MAKIAYGFTVAWAGLDGIAEAYVLPAILGEATDVFRCVGSAPDREVAEHNALHGARPLTRGDEVMVRVAPFSVYGCPEYFVVVGWLTDQGLARLAA